MYAPNRFLSPASVFRKVQAQPASPRWLSSVALLATLGMASPALAGPQAGPPDDPRGDASLRHDSSGTNNFALLPNLKAAVHGPRSARPCLQAQGAPLGGRVVLWMAPDRKEPGLDADLAAHRDLVTGSAVDFAVADGGGEARFAHAMSQAGGWTYRVILPPQAGVAKAQVGPPLTPMAMGGFGVHAPQTGEIIVTEFLKDPVLVTDHFGEYIELWNTGPVDLDIAGWVLSDMGSDSLVLDNGGFPMVVPTRGHLVIAREVSPLFNGGIFGALEYVGMTLSNSADEIVLSRPDGTVVDEVVYLDGPDWPDQPGLSIELRQDRLGTRWNDLVIHWCYADTFFGLGDSGSPGDFNGYCP